MLPLTSVRFFAAFGVVLYHAFETFPDASIFRGPEWTRNLLKSGFVGVNLFFILSGFVLAYNYLNKDLHLKSGRRVFWMARFARIYPVYALGLAVSAPKFLTGLFGAKFAVGKALFAALCALTLTQAWVPQFALAWNGPGWSLSAEAFFYMMFPFVALGVQRLRTRGACLGLMLLCWLASMLPPVLFYSVPFASISLNDCVKFNPLFRLAEFCLGVCLSKIFLQQSQANQLARFPTAAALVLTTVSIGFALSLRTSIPKLLLHNGLLDPLFALAVFSLAWTSLHPHTRVRWLTSPLLVLLGETSYALYILHVPIRGLLFGALGFMGVRLAPRPALSSMMFVIYIGLIIGASMIAFWWIETPARRWINRTFCAANPRRSQDPSRINPNPPPTANTSPFGTSPATN